MTTGNSSQFFNSPKWVTGTTYAEGVVVWSPSDYQYYMRKSTGAGATDPSSDTTNWIPTGDRAIKSIQRGTISVNASGTATISSVNTAKTELRMLGFSVNGTTLNSLIPRIALTNSTTITANTTSGGETATVSWELTERY